MSKPKLEKFAELATFPNVFQNFSWEKPALRDHRGQTVDLRGRWGGEVFGNAHPITLELACGRGEYTVALAGRCPDRNFLGVDIKGNRMWTGARRALDRGLPNVAFLRTDITLLDRFLGPEEAAEIWITFPDPHGKKSKWKKRLTAPRFLALYRKFCLGDAVIHLKTDEPGLVDFTLETARKEDLTVACRSDNIDRDPPPLPELAIRTRYERMHREAGKPIRYVRFRLHPSPDDPPGPRPPRAVR